MSDTDRSNRSGVSALLASLAGARLEAVHYIAFGCEDPARRDEQTPNGAHFVDMDVELVFAGGLVVCLSWSNELSTGGEYELMVRGGASILAVDNEVPDPWHARPWESEDARSDRAHTFHRWDMRSHPRWAPLLGLHITQVTTRWYTEGVWDLTLDFEGTPVTFYCWTSDVVFVSREQRPPEVDPWMPQLDVQQVP